MLDSGLWMGMNERKDKVSQNPSNSILHSSSDQSSSVCRSISHCCFVRESTSLHYSQQPFLLFISYQKQTNKAERTSKIFQAMKLQTQLLSSTKTDNPKIQKLLTSTPYPSSQQVISCSPSRFGTCLPHFPFSSSLCSKGYKKDFSLEIAYLLHYIKSEKSVYSLCSVINVL